MDRVVRLSGLVNARQRIPVAWIDGHGVNHWIEAAYLDWVVMSDLVSPSADGMDRYYDVSHWIVWSRLDYLQPVVIKLE